jgi:hypothetical protein
MTQPLKNKIKEMFSIYSLSLTQVGRYKMPSPQDHLEEDVEIYEMDDPNMPDYMKELSELTK